MNSDNEQHSLLDPSEVGATEPAGLVGPEYWTYAQIKDWILLCPDIPHTDVRVYGVFRSLATRWLNDQRVTKDRIRFMCPGTNGKPMSERTFDDVLRRLAAKSLVTIEKGSVNVRSVRNARTGRFERMEEMLFRVHELPEDGPDYNGWHTVREAFDAYPGPGWDRDQVEQNRRSRRPRNSADGTDRSRRTRGSRNSADGPTRTDQEKLDLSPGHTGRSSARNSAPAPRNSADDSSLNSDDAGDQTYSPDVPPIPTNQTSIDRRSAEHDDSTWLVGDQAQRDEETAGEQLLRQVANLAVLGRSAQTLSEASIATYRDIIDEALTVGVPADKIRLHLTDNLDSARNPAGVVVTRLKDLDRLIQRYRNRQDTLPEQPKLRPQTLHGRQPAPADLPTRVPDGFLPSRMRQRAV